MADLHSFYVTPQVSEKSSAMLNDVHSWVSEVQADPPLRLSQQLESGKPFRGTYAETWDMDSSAPTSVKKVGSHYRRNYKPAPDGSVTHPLEAGTVQIINTIDDGTGDDKVVVVGLFRETMERLCLEWPGGKIKTDIVEGQRVKVETDLEAAFRETREETGLSQDSSRFALLTDLTDLSGLICHPENSIGGAGMATYRFHWKDNRPNEGYSSLKPHYSESEVGKRMRTFVRPMSQLESLLNDCQKDQVLVQEGILHFFKAYELALAMASRTTAAHSPGGSSEDSTALGRKEHSIAESST